MDDENNKENKQQVNFNIDPNKTPVYFTDGYLISSNEFAVTFSFAQAVNDGSQQNIVARVAMTLPQAKSFLATLNDHLEKFER